MSGDCGRRLKELMLKSGKTLAVAESLTAGNLQAGISSTSGASGFFAGGITTYNLRQKVRHLGVDEEHAREVDCVSQRVADEMAAGCSRLFDADVTLATTGYAEPYPDVGVTEPHAYLAVFVRPMGIVYRERLARSDLERVPMQRWIVDRALEALVDCLEAA